MVTRALSSVLLFPSRRRHTRSLCDWSSDVCSSDLKSFLRSNFHHGVGGMHMYMPWWKFDRKNDFPRGYHIEIWGGRDMPGVGMFDGLCHREEIGRASCRERG